MSPIGSSALDQLADQGAEPAGEQRAAGVYPDDRQALRGRVLLGDLVGDPPQRPPQIIVRQHDLLVHCLLLLPGLSGPG